MLTQLRLKNFKSHKESSVDLRRITILIGPNSSGKSSFLQSLLVLKDSFNPPGNNRSPPITQTDNFDLGRYEDIITGGHAGAHLYFGIKGNKMMPHGLEEPGLSLFHFDYSVEFLNYSVNFINFEVNSQELDLSYLYKDRKVNVNALFLPRSTPISFHNDPNLDSLHPRLHASNTNEFIGTNFNDHFLNGKFTKNLLKEFYYVPYNRTATSYGVSLQSIFREGLYTNPTRMISHMISKLSKDPKLLDTVSNLVEEISGKTIRTRNLDLSNTDLTAGVTIDFSKKGFSNSIINEGTGLNQAILLLTTLAESPRDSIIGIEEPELHLHPKAQSKLSKIIMRMAHSHKKQIIFTTHSEHMLYPFLASIASSQEDSLKIDELSIYYVHQDDDTGYSIADHLPVNERGQIKGGLKGFWESDLEVFGEFLKQND